MQVTTRGGAAAASVGSALSRCSNRRTASVPAADQKSSSKRPWERQAPPAKALVATYSSGCSIAITAIE
jgi:hypothetical protein